MSRRFVLPIACFCWLPLYGLALAEPPVKEVTVLFADRTVAFDKARVEIGELIVPAGMLPQVNGFTLKPQGLCAADVCIPVAEDAGWTKDVEGKTYVNVSRVAEHLDQPVVGSKDGAVWSFGSVPRLQSSLLPAMNAPDFAVTDRKGKIVRLSDFRGKKVLLLTWASW